MVWTCITNKQNKNIFRNRQTAIFFWLEDDYICVLIEISNVVTPTETIRVKPTPASEKKHNKVGHTNAHHSKPVKIGQSFIENKTVNVNIDDLSMNDQAISTSKIKQKQMKWSQFSCNLQGV